MAPASDGLEILSDIPPDSDGERHVAPTGSLQEIEPPGQRTTWTRWFDRFVGPKRHPLPLTTPEDSTETVPAFVETDPFSEL